MGTGTIYALRKWCLSPITVPAAGQGDPIGGGAHLTASATKKGRSASQRTGLFSFDLASRFGAYSAFTFSVISGTASNRSATSPKSETLKIGASGSLLMQAMTFESFMPARC